MPVTEAAELRPGRTAGNQGVAPILANILLVAGGAYTRFINRNQGGRGGNYRIMHSFCHGSLFSLRETLAYDCFPEAILPHLPTPVDAVPLALNSDSHVTFCCLYVFSRNSLVRISLGKWL